MFIKCVYKIWIYVFPSPYRYTFTPLLRIFDENCLNWKFRLSHFIYCHPLLCKKWIIKAKKWENQLKKLWIWFFYWMTAFLITLNNDDRNNSNNKNLRRKSLIKVYFLFGYIRFFCILSKKPKFPLFLWLSEKHCLIKNV